LLLLASSTWETQHMFINLIESKPEKQRSFGGTFASVALHAVAITLAVYATAHAGEKVVVNDPLDTLLIYVPPPPTEAPAPQTTHAPTLPAAPLPDGPHSPAEPISFPNKIPDIDLPGTLTNKIDFRAPSPQRDTANGVGIGRGVSPDQPYSELQVEKPALARENNPLPKYPSTLESSRMEGEVLAQFVVDTLGKADMSTFKVLQASNELFASSLESTLPQWRFYPAEAGGHKVKQIVQLPLKFVAPTH
jgi:periplasmic protein TonB